MTYITPSDIVFIIGKIYLCIALFVFIDQFIRNIKSARYDKRIANEKDTS